MPDELASQTYALKHLHTGVQQTWDESSLVAVLRRGEGDIIPST